VKSLPCRWLHPTGYSTPADARRLSAGDKRFAVALEGKATPFAEEYIHDLANLQVAEISRVDEQAPDDLTWIAYTRKFTDELLKTVARRRASHRKRARPRRDWVLTVASPRIESVPTLHGLFSHIVGDSPSYRWLPKDELAEVLFGSEIDRADFIIAAAADPVTRTLSLVRGDCQQLVVPFPSFEPSGDGTKPDFSNVRVSDFGRMVALGDYEASTDAILAEADPEYRKKVNLQPGRPAPGFRLEICRQHVPGGVQSDHPPAVHNDPQ
jgi:hypothetical protein